MDRMPVHDNRSGAVVGWFDRDDATVFAEKTYLLSDGLHPYSVNTGESWRNEVLYRTAGGRWVLREWTRGNNPISLCRYRFITLLDARTWLIVNEHDQAVEEFFGSRPEPESGPKGETA